MADFDDALCADEIGSFHFINVSNVANIASAPGIPDVSDGQLRSEPSNDMVDEMRPVESKPDCDEFCQELGKSCQDDSNLSEDIIGGTVDCPEESDVDHHDVDEDHAVEENHVLDQSNDVAGAIEENPDLLDQSETVVSDPDESNAVPVQSDEVVAVSAAVPVVTNMEEYVALAKKLRCRSDADIDMDKEWKYNGESEFRKIAADFINRTKQELADSRARLRARTPMSARVAAVLDTAEQRRNEMIQASSKIREQKLAAVMVQRAGYVEPIVDLQESDSDTDDVGAVDDSDVSDPNVGDVVDTNPDVSDSDTDVGDVVDTNPDVGDSVDVLPDVVDSVDVLPDVDDEAVSDVDDEANIDDNPDDVNTDDHSNDDQDFDGSDTNTAETHDNLNNLDDVENNDPDFNDAVETTADAISHQIIAADN